MISNNKGNIINIFIKVYVCMCKYIYIYIDIDIDIRIYVYVYIYNIIYHIRRPLPGLGLGGAAPGITVGVRHWLRPHL